MTGQDYDNVAPDAAAMIESMRAHGYTLPTAIADIIDNSITAECRNIWIQLHWSEDDSFISITDDGAGMSEQQLVAAMRLGSKSPVEERSPNDLGRFGLGLKTASFSQARRLTVHTKDKEGEGCVRRWDLDHLARPEVEGWQLLRNAHKSAEPRLKHCLKHLTEKKTGTIVLLEILDRVAGADGDTLSADDFSNEVEKVRQHLAMVFHRLLIGSKIQRITIFLNDSVVEPWDPFCESMMATQTSPPDVSHALGDPVEVKGYVLPHRDRFDEEYKPNGAKKHRLAGGPTGWNAQQGFYVYRNRRLIIPGSWLELGPGQYGWIKEEHYKLARIRVDIPNSMDKEWKIDIKKSSAIAPPAIAGWMRTLAIRVRDEAKRVYAHRGSRSKTQSTKDSDPFPTWKMAKGSGDTFSYKINRKHPILDALIKAQTPEQINSLNSLLQIIEETVPVQEIWIDTAENQDGVASPFESSQDDQLRELLQVCHMALARRHHKSNLSGIDIWDKITDTKLFPSVTAQAIIGELKGAESSD